jgi:exodeoxyribonuclease VII small subunit
MNKILKDEEISKEVLPGDEQEEPRLEDLFEKIENIADELEGSEISLEESFALYDKGLRLLKQSSSIIEEIEKKVLVLDGKGEMREF